MLEAIEKINLYASGYNDPYVFFDANHQKDFNACLLLLMHIGEQVNRMSDTLKNTYAHIPWQAIKGFCNLIAHDYVGVDKLIVFETITNDLFDLQKQLVQIIQTGLSTGAFDLTEYRLSKESNFYRHIDFKSIQ